MTDLAQLRALLAKMTPGEWKLEAAHTAAIFAGDKLLNLSDGYDQYGLDGDNAAGIVALVNAAEPMLAEIEALRAEVARLHKQQAERWARLKEARMIKEGYL